jgi:hypothetical protein
MDGTIQEEIAKEVEEMAKVKGFGDIQFEDVWVSLQHYSTLRYAMCCCYYHTAAMRCAALHQHSLTDGCGLVNSDFIRV